MNEQKALNLLEHFARKFVLGIKYEDVFMSSDQHELFDKLKYGNIEKIYQAVQILQKLIDESENK